MAHPTRSTRFPLAQLENMALQGTLLEIIVHPMGGFDATRARIELEVPSDYTVDAMIAIGKKGNPEGLDERDKARETPSTRKPVKELLMEGKFDPALH